MKRSGEDNEAEWSSDSEELEYEDDGYDEIGNKQQLIIEPSSKHVFPTYFSSIRQRIR